MKVSSDTFEQDLRRIIREEVQPIVRQEVRHEVRSIIREEVRPIIQQETKSMRDDIVTIKSILGSHDLRLRTLTSEVAGIKSTLRIQVGEVKSLGVLLEDLEHRFTAAHE